MRRKQDTLVGYVVRFSAQHLKDKHGLIIIKKLLKKSVDFVNRDFVYMSTNSSHIGKYEAKNSSMSINTSNNVKM